MSNLQTNNGFTLPSSGRILMPFSVEAAIASLPVFCASPGMAGVLDTLLESLIQGGYQWIVRTAPTTQQQNGSNLVLANQGFEDQISVPTGSYLTMVGGIGIIQSDPSSPTNPYNTLSTNFRTKWYDAGAQSDLSDGFVHADATAGKFVPNSLTTKVSLTAGQVSNLTGNKNLFILPSPLSITNPGQLNVQVVNLLAQSMTIEMCFVFAAPMNNSAITKGAVIGNSVGR